MRLKELAEQIGAELVGGGEIEIVGVNAAEAAGENQITFLASPKHLSAVKKSAAAAVIVKEKIDIAKPMVVVGDVDKALIEVLGIFAPKLKAAKLGISATAIVDAEAKIGEGVSVGDGTVIEAGAEIGDNSLIGANCFIGQNSKIGANSRIDSNVVIYHNCSVGSGCVVQANTTIGSTGFGYAVIDGKPTLVPHNGKVVIEDCVEIGANCCIDRAKFGETIIGAGTKIDNLVQIAHNVVIGKCCFIVSQVGIAGSSKIGDGVVLAGQAGLVDNITLGDRVVVGPQAGVTSDVGSGGQVAGSPATDAREWLKVSILLKKLPEMNRQLKEFRKRIDKLEAKDNS